MLLWIGIGLGLLAIGWWCVYTLVDVWRELRGGGQEQ